MKTFEKFNRWTDDRPGRTLLAIFIVLALAYCMVPADPVYVPVAGVVR